MARSTHLVAVSGTEGIGADGSACSSTASTLGGVLIGLLAGAFLTITFHEQFGLVLDSERARKYRRNGRRRRR